MHGNGVKRHMKVHLKNYLYSGSVVKTKILDFYNELIWLINNRVQWENSGLLPKPHIYIKLHTARALPDSSIQPVFCSQGQNDIFQICKCGCNIQSQFLLP